MITSAEMGRELGPALAFTAFFIWVFNLIDAGRMAALYNHAAAGSDRIEMPRDLRLPRLGGSIVGRHAAELISVLAVAVTNGLRVNDIVESLLVHPSLAEALADAAE